MFSIAVKFTQISAAIIRFIFKTEPLSSSWCLKFIRFFLTVAFCDLFIYQWGYFIPGFFYGDFMEIWRRQQIDRDVGSRTPDGSTSTAWECAGLLFNLMQPTALKTMWDASPNAAIILKLLVLILSLTQPLLKRCDILRGFITSDSSILPLPNSSNVCLIVPPIFHDGIEWDSNFVFDLI